MVEWVTEVLNSSSSSSAVFPAAFLLGLAGSATSCCNLPILAAIAGYSGTFSDNSNRKALLLGALFFMLGTIGAFAALGAVSGFVGQVAGTSLGLYWKLFAGFVMVFFGLATLNLLPFDSAKLGFSGDTWKTRSYGATLYGLAIGGGAAGCSLCCNPVLPVALAVTTVQGNIVWGAGILTAFAIGYSLPMAGGLIGLGLGFGKLTSVLQRVTPVIQTFAGVLLIVIGFYLLASP
jgi:cytochrome c-type biogenesis protein